MSHAVVSGAAWRLGMSHAVVCRVMHGGDARHTMAGNILLHIQNLRSTPFTPFLSVREPSAFSRRTSVAWRTRALTTIGYQFRARPSSVASQLYAATSQARSEPARERPPAFTGNTKNTKNTKNTIICRGGEVCRTQLLAARLGFLVCCTRIVCNSVLERGALHFLSTVFSPEKARYFFL